jgi:hypothetical protein
MKSPVSLCLPGLEFQKMLSTAIPSFFAAVDFVNAFLNLNFPHSMAKKLCTTAIALSALVKFEPWSSARHNPI